MIKKISLAVVIVFVFFVSIPAVSAQTQGADSQIPELNPFCWKRQDCYGMRKQFLKGNPSDEDLKEGFITGNTAAPCIGGAGDDQWGRCLPAGKTKTEISFAGRSDFNNIGDFIVTMYKYLISVASIVAVIMIIIAGLQWITSGGNSETISSAKSRIGGAVIGLFIAYLSYFILYTINPAIVNFRLPQVWLVRPQQLMPQFCSQIPNAEKINFAYIGTLAEQPNMPSEPQTKEFKYNISDKNAFACGNKFLAENGGDGTCLGRVCEDANGEKQACYTEGGKGALYKCGNVIVSGAISYSALVKRDAGNPISRLGLDIAEDTIGVVNQWADPPVQDTGLVIICEDQEKLEVVEREQGGSWYWNEEYKIVPKRRAELDIDTSHGEKSGHYRVEGGGISAVLPLAEKLCGNSNKIRGFVLRANMIYQKFAVDQGIGHLIGKNGVDLGDAKFWGYANKIDKRYLLSVEDVKDGGAILNFDASNVSYSAGTEKYRKYLEPRFQNAVMEVSAVCVLGLGRNNWTPSGYVCPKI